MLNVRMLLNRDLPALADSPAAPSTSRCCLQATENRIFFFSKKKQKTEDLHPSTAKPGTLVKFGLF